MKIDDDDDDDDDEDEDENVDGDLEEDDEDEGDDSSLTDSQLEDLGTLFARSLSRETIIWLATSVLSRDAAQAAGNEIGDSLAFARRMVLVMNEAGKLQEAIPLLTQEARRGGPLVWQVNSILRGNRLGNSAAMQAFVNEYQPFFAVAGLEESLKRIKRTVCAVGLDGQYKIIPGSGFLVGPDLVMTNYHVVENFLTEQPDHSIVPNVSGDQIICFFDYFMEPRPRIPPGGIKHASTAVRAADQWLVHARKKLPFDGMTEMPTTVTDEYDYVIIRLSKPIGDMPTRQGGGTIRGWLRLPEKIYPAEKSRLMVFQHPGGYAQQIDIGDLLGLDPSKTRIRYTVSTANGSSGGPAVDAEGELYALHNAEVQTIGTNLAQYPRVNQGVRIDKIAEDLASAKIALSVEGPKNSAKVQFWSLNDDPRDPQPILGRMRFRDFVTQTHTTGSPRVVAVTGPPGSGVQFSIRVLQRTLGAQTPLVVFTPKDLQTLSPRDFLRSLVDGIGINIRPGDPIPPARDTENIPRWLRLDLPAWLKRYLDEDERQKLRPYPVWIVMNGMVPVGERMLWADNLKDFAATLTGARDAGQAAVDLPQLRWLFLGQKLDGLPVSGVPYEAEDLTVDQSYDADFVECIQLAWRSVLDKEEDEIDKNLLLGMAAALTAAAGTVPTRKFLANGVRNMIIRATAGESHV
jgi:hypothetical protein